MAKFPAFSLPGSDGKTWSLKDLKGRPFVMYFYPKDATPGCTVEACDFRDHQPDFGKAGVPVFGVSPDPLTSHAKFIAKQKLNFVLLADEQHALAEKLGVWGEKSMYGKKFMGIIRSTFLVDADGAIVQEWRKVSVDGHVAEVLEAVKGLGKTKT
jgi:peroxiredoxin Q/BCP